MKEIDFLPEWYKCGQRRQISYRTQCLALGSIFLVMMVWSLTATHSISKAKAELADMGTKQMQAEHISFELVQLRNELRKFQNKAASVDEIDSKIDVANVLAELSFLVDKRVVLSRVEMAAEKLTYDKENKSSAQAGTIVRVVRETSDKKNLPLGDARFKIIIAGVAADASDVAALMCKLEDSPYFRQVVLCFSRSAEAKNDKTSAALKAETDITKAAPTEKDSKTEANPAGNIQVTEFEINCYLANYQES